MGREHHDWQIGQPPPLIRPHSLAKHRVFRAYLERYVSVLTANPRQEQFRLTLIDGFAGGGRYLDCRTKEDRPGSPLIMLEAMDKAAEEAQKIRSKPFHLDVQYIFVEKDAEALGYLRSVLVESPYGKLIDDRIHLMHGEFTAKVPEITKFIQQRGRANRAIFMLDQFGYSDVPLPTIREILSTLDNAEVILTFATDFLIDYLSTNEQTQTILQNVGIALPSKEIATAKEARDWRRTIQFALHREIPERTGAKFYTPFFIRSSDAHRDFWLIHLSGHFRARDVMVGLHWKESTSFAHYGGRLILRGQDDAKSLAAQRAVRDALRYRRVLAEALATVHFTAPEASLVCDALNGIGMLAGIGDEHDSEPAFWPASVADHIRLNRADEKWGVDGPTLLEKIGSLTCLQKLAVADAVETWWRLDERDTIADSLAAVGLIH